MVKMSTSAQNTTYSPNPPWIILVVDDEPEVHEVTKLVLSDIEFEGTPVALHSAYSAKQAKSFLQTHPNTAVLLLDVVMETDDAGLSLARYIRDDLRDEDIQIVLRTGQPGHAPEKSVILNYDINGYFLKTEVTAQKLYSIIISSLRSYKNIKNVKCNLMSPINGPSARPSDRLIRLIDYLRVRVQNQTVETVAQPLVFLSNNEIAGIYCMYDAKGSGIRSYELSRFINMIDDEELLLKLNKLLLDRVCKAVEQRRSIIQAHTRLVIPIFSANANIGYTVKLIEEALSRIHLGASLIEIELRDTVAGSKNSETLESIRYLRTLGVHISLVYSGSEVVSLSHLRQIHPTRLVIPESLIRDISNNSDTSTIVRSMIALAHTMGMSVFAQGVTTQDNLEFLKWEGCDVASGNLIARTLSIDKCIEFISSSTKRQLH